MFNKKINNISPKGSILIVPLDWGLGHATRCIPLVKELLANDCSVIIAAESNTKALLKLEFQQLTFLNLKGYRIRYSKTSYWFPLKIIFQVPRMLLSIYKEQLWLKKVVKKYSIKAVIADNRFGLYHPGIKSVYITHQLLIKTGNRFSEKFLQRIHYWFIKKYNFCWIPDFAEKNNLAGELCHPLKLPPNATYIGCLSRFQKKAGLAREYNLLIILSGPEPQRSIFEKLLLQQLKNYTGKCLLVRGLPGNTEETDKNPDFQAPGVTTRNHLSARELSDAVQQADLVISRSGYTTIMDLIRLKQKGILVPTPGQTEQEYLARHMMEQQFFFAANQQDFVLDEVLKKANDFSFITPSFNMEQYKKVVYNFVRLLEGER